MIAVTFDYGQTLAELDTKLVSRRVEERGARVDVARLDAECPAAWDAYNEAKRRGETGYEAWRSFMSSLLERAGVRAAGDSQPDMTAALVDFLWSEQPRKNLWRKPIPGMMELVQELAARAVPLGIVSNSEGRLAELLEEMRFHSYFSVVADSGRLGFEKPDPRIFEFVAAGLGVETSELVHVGDAWVADVEGALGVGARAIWVTNEPNSRRLPAGVVACRSPKDVRSALRALGIPA